MFEFRHLVQPVKISWDDPEKLSFKLTNCRDFTTLEDLTGVWKMEVDGNIVLSGNIPDFTAVAACSDDEIRQFIVSMKQNGIEWVGRKAMIGFGNVPGISDVYPIATVDQHPRRIGAESYRLLARKIEDPEMVIQEYLDTELVNLQNIPVLS